MCSPAAVQRDEHVEEDFSAVLPSAIVFQQPGREPFGSTVVQPARAGLKAGLRAHLGRHRQRISVIPGALTAVWAPRLC